MLRPVVLVQAILGVIAVHSNMVCMYEAFGNILSELKTQVPHTDGSLLNSLLEDFCKYMIKDFRPMQLRIFMPR
jgi:hypothetical protein